MATPTSKPASGAQLTSVSGYLATDEEVARPPSGGAFD